MNKTTMAWKRFEESGCVADYLSYRQAARSEQVTEGGLHYADFDRRYRPENETGRQ